MERYSEKVGAFVRGLVLDDGPSVVTASIISSVWRSWEKAGRFAGSPSSPILADRSLILIWTALLS